VPAQPHAPQAGEDRPLEPLAVYDDGVAFEPEAAARPRESWRDARSLMEAARTALDERRAARAQPPWVPAAPSLPPPGPGRFLSTFTRMIGLHPAVLEDLPDWWGRHARDEQVHVARRFVLEEPHYAASGTWQAHGRLRTRWLRRSIPVDLQLWPYLGAWTKVCLQPQRRVHAGRRYFRHGHRALDLLTARLVGELQAHSSA
jgi:hypothetical protein